MRTGWLIERRAPQEPTAYWGNAERWVVHPRTGKPPAIPEAALVYTDYDVALAIAEWLRTNQPLAWGEVIAIVSADERVQA